MPVLSWKQIAAAAALEMDRENMASLIGELAQALDEALEVNARFLKMERPTREQRIAA